MLIIIMVWHIIFLIISQFRKIMWCPLRNFLGKFYFISAFFIVSHLGKTTKTLSTLSHLVAVFSGLTLEFFFSRGNVVLWK